MYLIISHQQFGLEESPGNLWTAFSEYRKLLAPFFIFFPAKNVRVVVSTLRRGPGNTHGFVLYGKSHRQGWATAQIPCEPAASSVRIASLIMCTCNLTPIACGRLCEVARHSSEHKPQLYTHQCRETMCPFVSRV